MCPPVCGSRNQLPAHQDKPNVSFIRWRRLRQLRESRKLRCDDSGESALVNDKCTACNACAEACPATRSNEFNFGMDTTKAAYLPFNQAFPQQYVIDAKACKKDCGTPCKEACKYECNQSRHEAGDRDGQGKQHRRKRPAGILMMRTRSRRSAPARCRM